MLACLVTPAVAARPLPGLVAVRALRVLFVAFLVLFVAFPVRRSFWRKTKICWKKCWKKCSFFCNTSRLFKNVPKNLNFRACLLHNVSLISIKSNYCK